MTAERFAKAKKLPEDITLVTEFTQKKYLKKLTTVQLQKEYETLKLTLIHCINGRELKDKESTRAMKEYWNFMNRLEEEQQRRMGKSRYIKLK